MPKRRLGLRGRFILLIVVGLSVIFVAVAVLVIRQTSKNLRSNLVAGSQSFAALATKPIGDTFVTFQDSGQIKIVQQVQKFTALDENISNVAVVDVSGKTLYDQNDAKVSVSEGQASSFNSVEVSEGGTLRRIISPYLEDSGAHRYSVVYDISSKAIDKSIRELTTGIIVLAFFALVGSIIISYYLISWLFLTPVSTVSSGAITISEGNLDTKIEPKRNDEIGDLAKSVNTMAEALKADIRKLEEVDAVKSEFMTIASHNLRTPLTVMKGYLETLETLEELPESAHKMIRTITGSTNRLSVFAEDMLIIARLESGQEYASANEDCNLTEIIRRICDDAEPLANEKQLEFVKELPDTSCTIQGSPPHMRAALWNVLDNALKFTKEGRVVLRLRAEAGKAIITVEDTGVGVSAEEQPKLFTKFHRGTDIMEYNYEGTGIGLYLTKLIVENHKGTITVTSAENKGTTVTITLPLTQS